MCVWVGVSLWEGGFFFPFAFFSVLPPVCFPLLETMTRNSPNLFYVMVVLAPQTSRKVVSLNIHYLTNSSIALTLQLVAMLCIANVMSELSVTDSIIA